MSDERDMRAGARTKWVVTAAAERIALDQTRNGDRAAAQVESCHFPGNEFSSMAQTTSYTIDDVGSWPARVASGLQTWYHTGWVRWQVAALDDFGTPGPFSEPHYFRMPAT